jgi:hypothetical protein
VVVAVVGFNLLGPRSAGGVGGPGASPSPSPTASPSPTPTLEPLPTPTLASNIFTSDPIPVGTYPVTYDGLPLSVTVPVAGWKAQPGNAIGKGDFAAGTYAGIDFWLNAPDNVYSDPCAHTPLDPKPVGAAELAAAAAAIPGTTVVSGPTSVELGGHPAHYVELTISQDLACEPNDAWLWYDDSSGGPTGGWRWAEGTGTTYRLWIADIDGKVVFIDGYTLKDASPELGQELRDIVESITFG